MANQYNGLIPSIIPYVYKGKANKDKHVKELVMYFLNRLQSMFEWKGLPDTIPQRDLKLFLMTNGNVCFTKVGEDYYVFTGGYGGEPNAYYRPTTYIVANPYLKFNKTLKIGVDCEVIPNDSMYMGLLPLLTRYCTLMVENELTLWTRTIASRSEMVVLAEDSKGKLSFDTFIKNLEEGTLASVLNKPTLFDGIKTTPYSNASGNAITQHIELQQYLKASLYNEIGLNANYNMKRESINSGEATLNDDALLPLIDDMLNTQQIACERINKLYGLNVSVDYSSVWKQNEEEIEKALENEETDIKTDEKEVTQDETTKTD